MTLLRDILSELRGMFLGDARLTTGIVLSVVLAGLLLRAGLPPRLVGLILLLACLGLLVVAVLRAARRR